MKKINYINTWCDYLTKCPHNNDIEVSSYECCNCECFNGIFPIENKENDKILNLRPNDPNYMKRYFLTHKGYVLCSKQ